MSKAVAPSATPQTSVTNEDSPDIPRNASVVSDNELDHILARFYPGGELEQPGADSTTGNAAAAPAQPANSSTDGKPPVQAKTESPVPQPAPDVSSDQGAGSPSQEGEAPPEGQEAETTTDTTPAEDETPPEPEAATEQQQNELKALQDQIDTLQRERDALSAQLSTSNTRTAIPPEEIDPLMASDLPDLERRQAEITAFRKFAITNWNGFENPNRAGPSYSAEQIQQKYREVELEANTVLPQAIELAKARLNVRAVAKEAYPEMYDSKKPEYLVRENFFKRFPSIKAVFPEMELWLGHMLAGERAYKARTAAGKAAGKTPAPAARKITKAPPKPPVPLPSNGAAHVSATPPRRTINDGLDAAAILKAGNDRNALIAAIRSLGG